jgi:hypothetical protein
MDELGFVEQPGLSFGEMLPQLRGRPGMRAARTGWYQQVLVFVPGSTITVTADRPLGQALPTLVGTEVRYHDHLDTVDLHGNVEVWTPTQGDVLAHDWHVAPSHR